MSVTDSNDPGFLDCSYDLATDIGRVRMKIRDTDFTTLPDVGTPREDWTVLFVDAEIAATLGDYAGSPHAIFYAAADLLDTMAADTAMLAKLLTLGDYSEDTRNVAATISQRAAAFRLVPVQLAQVAAQEPAESVTDFAWTDTNLTRIIFRLGVNGNG